MSFAELGLSDKVQQAVEAAGYSQPTPIQSGAIPHVLARRDVLGIAQTGTGKTAAFVLPMLTLLETGRARARMPRTLILEPTRELAAQVQENFDRYGANHPLSVALIIGGVSFGDQDVKIGRGVDVLIATPGRLLDHIERGKLLLNGVELLVIDEADRMLDMGFIPDIERIAKLVPFTRQTLFFSATMPPEIQRLADTFLHNAARVEVARPASTAATITQRLFATGAEAHEKRDRLRDLIRGATDLKNAIIFCNRKREVAVLHRSLQKHGFNAACLHGDMDQRARTLALDSFRSGEVPILVASDVAARGLDIPAVSHVFNYDIPHHAEDYVHRIGRTGRAGRSGSAFTLIGPGDEKSLAAIESLIGQPVEWETGSGLADLAGLRAERPARPREGGGREGGGRESGAREGRAREAGGREGGGRGRGGGGERGSRDRARGRSDGRRGERDESDRETRQPPRKLAIPGLDDPRAEGPRAEAASPEAGRQDSRPASRSREEPRPRDESRPRPEPRRREEPRGEGRGPRGEEQRGPRGRTARPLESARPSAPAERRGPVQDERRDSASDERRGGDAPVTGLGDHVPAFLLKAVPAKRSVDEA